MNFVKLFDDTGYVLVDAGEEGSIDAAVERYVTSGGTVDTLLCVTLLDGSVYKVKASLVTAWYLSTPEGRMRGVEIEKQLGDEIKANRAAAGLFGDE